MSAGPDHGPARLGPLPRPLALALVGVWALVTVTALVSLLIGPASWSGQIEGLVPEAHRSQAGRVLVLLRVDADKLAELAPAPGSDGPLADASTGLDPRTILAEAGFAIEEAFADERVPLAPPKTEITRWLDAHALYLLPIDTHAALAERLSDAAMLAQVQSLAARLSSPLYSVSGDQARRDPLGIHELTGSGGEAGNPAGRLGHVAELPDASAPTVGANGDLISAGGDRALMALLTTRPPDELQTQLEVALAPMPIEIELIDPRLQAASVAAKVGESSWALLGGCFAGLVLLLSITLRKVTPVLILTVCLGAGWVQVMWLGLSLGLAQLDLFSLALSMLLLAVACDGALRLPEIGARGWASTLLLALAAVPLWLSPYPVWQQGALLWPLAFLLLTLSLRVLLPILLELARADLRWPSWRAHTTPRPVVALLACVGLCAAASWLAPQLDYRAPARIPLVEDEQRMRERELTEHFFDPSMIVEVSTPTDTEREAALGSPEAAALDAAAESTGPLAELVPTVARRFDSPASFVLPEAELAARKQALTKLELGERMQKLQLMLVDRGLRSEAFSEFVHATADIDDLPSAAAALDGPLGPWIRGYVRVDADGETVLRGRVELRGRDGLPVASLSDAQLAELPPLRGPAIAAMIDQRELTSRVVLVLVAGWWLTALLVWLGTGELTRAIACALVAASAQAGLVVALALLEQPGGPQLLPVLLLVGAAASLTGARACRATDVEPPMLAGLLVSSGCQTVVGVVMLSSSQPLWRELGLALALGSVLAGGLGMFITPGLAALLRRRSGATQPKGRSA